MSDIGKRIDSVIRLGLAPLLKREGFKKKGRTFHREWEDHIDVINVQADKWNEGNTGQFTINVGVYYPEIADITEALPVKGMVREYDCTIRDRIGMLSKKYKDEWWSIKAPTDEEALARDVADKVQSICVPWLTRMSDLETVKVSLANNQGAFVAAGIALHQGNREEAMAYLEQSFEQQPLAIAGAKAWGIKHGLVQP